MTPCRLGMLVRTLHRDIRLPYTVYKTDIVTQDFIFEMIF